LSGVRRSGKTVISQSVPKAKYFDCELPGTRRLMDDPEKFLNEHSGERVILDEIHRLQDPSELLKIAADHFPKTRILATGSSSLGASVKFKDTLTGRKSDIWLTPLMSDDLRDFKLKDFNRRLLFGGLPPLFLSRKLPERYFQEWVDAYWAKDIAELFRVERRYSFQKFLEMLMLQSGGIFEANKFSGPCGVSHTTIANYLMILEETYALHVLRPFNTNKSTEIVAAPKVYMFDTGFVNYYRGVSKLNSKDMGYLWEHYVLNELHALLQPGKISYWRDKQGHEIDFIVERRGLPPLAIEAKWKGQDFDYTNLKVFMRQYPYAQAWVVTKDLIGAVNKKFGDVAVKFAGLDWLKRLGQ